MTKPDDKLTPLTDAEREGFHRASFVNRVYYMIESPGMGWLKDRKGGTLNFTKSLEDAMCFCDKQTAKVIMDDWGIWQSHIVITEHIDMNGPLRPEDYPSSRQQQAQESGVLLERLNHAVTLLETACLTEDFDADECMAEAARLKDLSKSLGKTTDRVILERWYDQLCAALGVDNGDEFDAFGEALKRLTAQQTELTSARQQHFEEAARICEAQQNAIVKNHPARVEFDPENFMAKKCAAALREAGKK